MPAVQVFVGFGR